MLLVMGMRGRRICMRMGSWGVGGVYDLMRTGTMVWLDGRGESGFSMGWRLASGN